MSLCQGTEESIIFPCCGHGLFLYRQSPFLCISSWRNLCLVTPALLQECSTLIIRLPHLQSSGPLHGIYNHKGICLWFGSYLLISTRCFWAFQPSQSSSQPILVPLTGALYLCGSTITNHTLQQH